MVNFRCGRRFSEFNRVDAEIGFVGEWEFLIRVGAMEDSTFVEVERDAGEVAVGGEPVRRTEENEVAEFIVCDAERVEVNDAGGRMFPWSANFDFERLTVMGDGFESAATTHGARAEQKDGDITDFAEAGGGDEFVVAALRAGGRFGEEGGFLRVACNAVAECGVELGPSCGKIQWKFFGIGGIDHWLDVGRELDARFLKPLMAAEEKDEGVVDEGMGLE